MSSNISFYQNVAEMTSPGTEWTTSESNDLDLNRTLSDIDLEADEYLEDKISFYIDIYYRIIIHMFGIVGNILSFVIMTRASLRKMTTCLYMAVIALCDLTTTFVAIVWWFKNFDIHLVTTPWGCRVNHTAFFISIHTSVTLIIAMTVEKFIAVWFPFRASTICTRKNAKIVIILVVLVMFGLNLNHLFTRNDVAHPKTNISTCFRRSLAYLDSPHKYFHVRIWPWIDAAIYSFIPLSALITFNSLILIQLKKANMKQEKMIQGANESSSKGNRGQSQRNQNQVTLMLLLVTSAFIALTLPLAVMIITEKYWIADTGHAKAVRYLLKVATADLMYTNHAINFFLYCVSGSRFRAELYHILCCCFRRRQTNEIFQKTTSTASSAVSKI